jgi:hypothetical protein
MEKVEYCNKPMTTLHFRANNKLNSKKNKIYTIIYKKKAVTCLSN